jgi:PAS domain S-box-containing protein
MNAIKRWLAPPVFEGEEEKTRQASLINMIGISCLVFMLVLLVSSLLAGNTPIRTLIIDLFFGCAVILQFLRWLRSGRVALARLGYVIFGLVYITGVTASIGTIRTPTAAIFVFWVLMTGLLFGLRGILFGTPAASLAVLGLIVAENAGWLRQPFQGVGLTQWITFTALFGFTSGLTYYIIQGTEKALARAEKEIEQRRQVEASLKESEQRYRTLVEWTLDPIAVHRDGKTLYVNPAAIKMFGAVSAGNLVGTPILDRVHPGYHQIALARVKNYFELGQQSPVFEQKLLKLDGTVIDVEVQGMTISYDGRPAVQVTMRDITERKRIEAALMESEQRYRTLVEWTPEPIVVHRRGSILYANPAAIEMFGAGSASDLIGSSMLDRVHPDFREIATVRLRNYAEYGLNTPMTEQKFLKLDGTVMDVEIQDTTITFDEEPALHVSVRDITKRKAIEAALEAARLKAESSSQAKSRFLASASHDLRQPAHALGMFVARLGELPHDTQTSHLVDCMDASVRAMQDMLDGFFDISRLDSERTQISRVAFPIESIFGQLRNSFEGVANDKGLRLRFRPSTTWVESDPGLLHRILLNLVSNAIRYTQQGGVLVACRPTHDDTQLRIEVRDSGVGIAPQHHEEIFQEFFQVANAQRDRSKGLGVGLSIVDRACRLLNHPLALRSAPGCGTRFTLTVPLAPARAGGMYERAIELAAQTSFDCLRVLLIEDDALGRVGLASLLTSWGCNVMVAEGAQEACDLYRQEQALDIVISDFRLGGGINGIEAVAMLSAIAGRRIAACLISGDTAEAIRQQAQAGGLALLHKPVRPAKLRSLLRRLVQASSVH